MITPGCIERKIDLTYKSSNYQLVVTELKLWCSEI